MVLGGYIIKETRISALVLMVNVPGEQDELNWQ